MTDAILVQIADCVLADYQAAFKLGRISSPIVAKYASIPEFTPGKNQQYGVNEVIVCDDREQTSRISRDKIDVKYMIEVGVCVRLRKEDGCDDYEVRPCKLLCQTMADLFFDFGLSNGLAVWQSNEVFFWGDKERLKLDGTFFALWEMTFVGVRTKG